MRRGYNGKHPIELLVSNGTVLYCTVLYCIGTHTGGADEVVRVCPGRVTVVGHTAHHHHRPPGRAHLPGGGVRYELNQVL